jgi:hypothetical protein
VRAGLVTLSRAGGLSIVLFDDAVPCSKSRAGGPSGLGFEISDLGGPADVSLLPVGKPLRSFKLWWNTHAGSNFSDGLLSFNSVTLTRIDTRPNGVWAGDIKTELPRTSAGKKQAMEGHFTARWCGSIA